MSELSDAESLVTQLNEDIDELQRNLRDITDIGLGDATSDMNAIDKSKTYMLALYALNSSLFAALRLAGIDTTNHPIMEDIRRVQVNMAKIKNAEEVQAGRLLQVDREAAGRFIKHALSGNDSYDDEKAAREKRQKEVHGVKTVFKDEDVEMSTPPGIASDTEESASAASAASAAATKETKTKNKDLPCGGTAEKKTKKKTKSNGRKVK
ncbi:hypothetical protein V1514DRAFT_335879 [Lipomyces japonicus]|uniref:uncharacterized protein n=1 Tax=Lipomyces japonicus TaxID=56871 RepID=UPI0034CD865F